MKVSLSGVTVARRSEELAVDIENTLKDRASNFVFYSIALYESTDITDTSQLAIVIRGIDDNFNITEEMAALFLKKGTTKGSDLLNALKSTLLRFNLKLNDPSGVVTDGAPAMVGKDKGLVALIRKEAGVFENSQFMQYHCVQNACPLKMPRGKV
jgi:hypothetical protein